MTDGRGATGVVPRVLLAAGVGLFALAVGESLAPGLLPNDVAREVVYVAGVALLGYAFLVVRRRDGTRYRATPDPELPVEAPAPGEDLRTVLDAFRDRRRSHRGPGLVDALRRAAITVLVRFGDCSEDAALDRIEDGTWTDDPVAAAYLGSGESSTSVLAALRDAVGPETTRERNVRRTVDAIVEAAGLEVPPGDGGWRSRLPGWPIRTDGTSVASTEGGGDRRLPPVDDPAGARLATDHWLGVSVVGIVGLGAGILLEQPPVLLAGVVGVGYAAYARSGSTGPIELSVERTFEDDPAPGEDVEVTVTVTNVGPRALVDLRLVDGVPAALAVVDGSARHGTSLRAGGSATFSYTVAARRGRHAFEPTLAVARDLPGADERTVRVGSDATLTCRPPLRPTDAPVSLRRQATRYAGRVETDTGGDGVEFHATRQYRPGDPTNRIDWHRRARTGELATLQFRQERAATVVLVVDTQPSAYRAHEPFAAHAVDRAVDAASQVFPRLLDDGHRVGVATLGPGDCWLPPRRGTDHLARARDLLATDPALSSVPGSADGNAWIWKRRLRRRLPADAQLVVFSPLCEWYTVRTVRQLEAYGHPVSVVSPDPTAHRTPAQRLLGVRRALYRSELRGTGVPVVDWAPDRSLEAVLAEAARRGRR